MIETLMIFALGFLAATLLSLVALPAVSARAARLTKRRIDATMPLSAGEIAAEKDYLRAQAAIAQRRLERKVEAARASRQADMAAIGARTMEAAALSRAVEARDSDLAAASEKLGGLEADLGSARSDGAIGAATLTALEDAHRALLDDFLETRRARAVEAAAPAEPVDLRTSHDALAAERATLRASLAAAEAALDKADSELRARIVEVADALTRGERLPSVAAFAMPASAPAPGR